MLADLHTHTTASDGSLTPQALFQRAVDRQLELLAVTDHDTMDGYLQLSGIAGGPTLIPGVEFSCVWSKMLIHVVGLQLDPSHSELAAGLARQHQARIERGQRIGEKMTKLGFADAYEAATSYADGGQIGRPHFARYLVAQGHVKNFEQAFKKYLGAGKPGDVKTLWPVLSEVVQWIVAAGGTAVIAHPQRYKMTATKLRALIKDFKAAGGQALEVISGMPANDGGQTMVRLCQQFELLASIGSDFHRPGSAWSELGCSGLLPAGSRPVWSAWSGF